MRAILLLLVALSATASESDYVTRYCDGEIEYVLPDRTRVDCLEEGHAWEFDFGRKWAESIGQALFYASHTGRRAGIALIIETESDKRGHRRAVSVIRHYGLPIDIWVVGE